MDKETRRCTGILYGLYEIEGLQMGKQRREVTMHETQQDRLAKCCLSPAGDAV
jgi:hypothetical protein